MQYPECNQITHFCPLYQISVKARVTVCCFNSALAINAGVRQHTLFLERMCIHAHTQKLKIQIFSWKHCMPPLFKVHILLPAGLFTCLYSSMTKSKPTVLLREHRGGGGKNPTSNFQGDVNTNRREVRDQTSTKKIHSSLCKHWNYGCQKCDDV